MRRATRRAMADFHIDPVRPVQMQRFKSTSGFSTCTPPSTTPSIFASKGAIQCGAGFRVDTLVQIDAAHFVPVCGVSGVIVYSIRLFPRFPLEVAGTRV